jgi:hypothetical protein
MPSNQNFEGFFLEQIPLFVTSSRGASVFSKLKKELPLVALFQQEKIHLPLLEAFHYNRGYKLLWFKLLDKILYCKLQNINIFNILA